MDRILAGKIHAEIKTEVGGERFAEGWVIWNNGAK